MHAPCLAAPRVSCCVWVSGWNKSPNITVLQVHAVCVCWACCCLQHSCLVNAGSTSTHVMIQCAGMTVLCCAWQQPISLLLGTTVVEVCITSSSCYGAFFCCRCCSGVECLVCSLGTQGILTGMGNAKQSPDTLLTLLSTCCYNCRCSQDLALLGPGDVCVVCL